ncbi:MAG: T9SS type A sorting domain-containing protein [Chitinophagaceae bacterium]
MKNLLIAGFAAILCMPVKISAQTTPQVLNNFGTWEAFTTFANKSTSPELKGRLCSIQWKQIEQDQGIFTWDALDTVLYQTAFDSLPLIFMVYTKEDAPDWLYTTGEVPKVIERNEKGDSTGYAPYYLDTNYREYFKEMVVRVKEHIDSLPWNIRQWIIGVQPCFGSTGDYISYKGFVDPQYQLTSQQFLSLFKEFTLDYYHVYKDTEPKITILSNPLNQGENQSLWLEDNCPGGWLKTGSLGKAYQLNDELDKSMWLMDLLNTPRNGDYVRARSEISGDGLTAGWWLACVNKNLFAVLANCIFWGVDWSNQNYFMINDPTLDPAYFFFNRYAGQKNPATSTNAMCALKDALDAADTERFPENIFGKANRKQNSRYLSILDSFSSYGAKLDDIQSVSKNEMGNRMAKGINDIGWRIFPGNYDRYLHQLTPNETSAGYWNVQSADSATTMYGRFARGFDLARNKDGLYFRMDSDFLKNEPLNAQYPVTLDIIYLDKGNGAWKLFYDATDSTDHEALSIQCHNTGYWKTAAVTLYDAYFGRRASRQSDFYIKNNGEENVIFELVEFARPDSLHSNVGIHTSSLAAFDTVCINSNSVKTFTVSGDFMNAPVQIGPAAGYSFSLSDSAFEDSLTISDYGNRFSKQVNVKLNTSDTGTFTTVLPVAAMSQVSVLLDISGTVVNSLIDVQANVLNVSCYNSKNGNISLQLDDSDNAYTYSWSEPILKFSSTNKNIASLVPGNYHLDLFSKGGCRSSADYTITQPDLLQVSISADSMICKNGFANVTVTATGGTMPYIGTGIIPTSAGNRNFTVIDSNGCSVNKIMQINNGTMVVPSKPVQVFSTNSDSTGLCNGGDFNFYVDTVSGATNYQWSLPVNCSIVSASADSSSIVMHAPVDFTSGVLNVVSANVCGVSTGTLIKNLSAIPISPSTINGPVSVLPSQKNITYSVSQVVGLTYTWNFPAQVIIISGQGTSSVKVNWGVIAGNASVFAQNSCGQSSSSVLRVNLVGNMFTLSNTSLPNFDTTCVNGLSSNSKSINITASNIYGAPVTIGPATGFKFSQFLTGTFTDSVVLSNYGTNLNKAVYIKFSPVVENTNAASIPISSANFQTAWLSVSGEGINSSPVITALVNPVNCFAEKNGTIEVQTEGGTGPYSYSWKSSSPPFSSTDSYISGLKAADYTVTINSYGGCNAAATFTVTQPDILKTSITADNMYCKNSTTNVYLNGTGGNLPYIGTGTFVKGPGSSLYTITDAKGCTAQQYFNVVNGTVVAPAKPSLINSADADSKGICFPGTAVLSVDPVNNATNYSWGLPAGFTFESANADSSSVSIKPPHSFSSGTINVVSGNSCGTSTATGKLLNAAPSKPPFISGLTNVSLSKKGLNYSTENIDGINYTWTVPATVTIISGQNTSAINVNWGTKAGYVSVKKLNGCAQSQVTNLYVSIVAGFQNSFSNSVPFADEDKNVAGDEKPFSVSVYPSPARDFTVIHFYMKSAKPYTVQLAGMDGKVLQNNKGISVAGKNELKINLAQYPNGVYQLIYFTEKGEKTVVKFTKEK